MKKILQTLVLLYALAPSIVFCMSPQEELDAVLASQAKVPPQKRAQFDAQIKRLRAIIARGEGEKEPVVPVRKPVERPRATVESLTEEVADLLEQVRRADQDGDITKQLRDALR